ncbi:fibropellin-1-like [Ruditapes philippinarum]|uniref:fibropellin-1-like n=1 Tax=Ruditapes philippinarum TaxID=129788 RepID=UPI00295B66AA|nr:fibropellin-1-like [Ruditapes philippinarum]
MPCKNGATCVDLVNDFSCTCVPGYTGKLCQTDINECETNQCQYNSTCVDLVNGFRCSCPAGITGDLCEINIDECANVTCQNEGVCNDYINKFECKCPMGFNGTYCENSLGRVCYNCEGVADDPTRCANRTLCGPGEQCYSEHELDAPGVFTYNLGCVPSKLCSYLENKNFRRRDIRPVQLCYECCDINGCNHHACADYN